MAASLQQRVADFPQWERPPLVEPAIGDLLYPSWFAGMWQMESTLTDRVAPLAPDIVTPGFEQQARYLNQPVISQVRFVRGSNMRSPAGSLGGVLLPQLLRSGIVADRAFNGLSLARAYLGNDAVLSVHIDPNNPNRQITHLQGGQQLIFTVTGRRTELAPPSEFTTTELVQQQFQRGTQVYLNTVETTTHYTYQNPTHSVQVEPQILATQLTAIYLSPQDPHYFQANNRPVALYRYQLKLTPIASEKG